MIKFKFKINILFEKARFKRFLHIFKIKNNKRHLKKSSFHIYKYCDNDYQNNNYNILNRKIIKINLNEIKIDSENNKKIFFF